MPARNVKGSYFTIIVDGKRILVEHCPSKGKRWRVSFPAGVFIETSQEKDSDFQQSSTETPAATEETQRSEIARDLKGS